MPRVISEKYESLTSWMITPTSELLDRARAWACAFGT
jgi:hypothetical protein